MNRNSAILKIAYIPLMSVIIALCAWITVPFAVPFTMQSFGIFLTLLLLGDKWGTVSILIYILMGVVGLPVFSGFGGGLGYLLGPTGGYIVGFVLCAVLYLITAPLRKTPASDYIFLVLGLLLCYLTGTLWFMYVSGTVGSPIGFLQASVLCVLPYIIPDILKLFLAGFLSRRLKSIKRMNPYD